MTGRRIALTGHAVATLGVLTLGAMLGGVSTAHAQSVPAGTIVCVHTAGGRVGQPLPRRVVAQNEPCGIGEERMRTVLLMTTPFVGSSPTTAPSGRRTESTLLATAAEVLTTAPVLIETTIVVDNHGAPLPTPGVVDNTPSVAVTCTTMIDGQSSGGAVELTVAQSAAPGGRDGSLSLEPSTLQPPLSQLAPGSSPDVTASTLRRFRQASVGRRRLAVVCQDDGLQIPLRGEITLVVLQSEY